MSLAVAAVIECLHTCRTCDDQHSESCCNSLQSMQTDALICWLLLGFPQVRVLSASMTIRQMFSGREQFRVLITDHVRIAISLLRAP
jgi:hypothetical protein